MLISKKIVDKDKGDVNKKHPVVRTLGESLKKYFGGSDMPSYLTIKKDDNSPDQKSDQNKKV